MVIINISSYPTESVGEAVKRLPKLPAPPDFMTVRGPYIRNEKGDGIQTIVIYEFDPSHYVEANEYIRKRIASFYGVPGYTCSNQPWLEAQDAIKLL